MKSRLIHVLLCFFSVGLIIQPSFLSAHDFGGSTMPGTAAGEGANENSTKNEAAGGKISLFDGSETFSSTDLNVRGVFPILFTRTYDSRSTYDSPLGYGWVHNYDITLTTYADNSVLIRWENGFKTRYVFSGGSYVSEEGDDGILEDNGDGSFTFTTPRGIKYLFNEYGNLTRITDNNGNYLLLSYSSTKYPLTGKSPNAVNPDVSQIVSFSRRLEKIEEGTVDNLTGRYVELFYNATTGRLDSVSDFSGRMVNYQHDTSGNLVRINYPEDLFHAYLYEDTGDVHNLTSFIKGYVDQGSDVSSVYYTNVYDTQDRVVRQDHAGGTMTVTYTLPLSRTTLTWQVKDAAGNTLHDYNNVFDFNADGYLIAVTDEEAQKIEYVRDSNNNITRKVIWNNSGTVSSPNLVVSHVVNYKYDAEGNMTLCELTLEDGEILQWAYTYDHNWLKSYNMTSSRYPAKQRQLTQTLAYNADGYPKYIIRKTALIADGETPEYLNLNYTYNTYGQLTAMEYDNGDSKDIVYSDGFTSNVDGLEYIYSSDRRGNMIEMRDAKGNRTLITYDTFDRPVTVTNPLNETSLFTYQGWNLVTIEKGKTGVIPGKKTHFSYDDFGRLLSSWRDLDGSPWMQVFYTYDSQDNILSLTDGQGKKVVFAYDAKKRPVSVIYPNGQSMTYSYDEHGNLSAVIDAAGKETKYIHDRYDRLTALTDTAGKTVFYQYELDKINKITDAKGQHLTFEYDQLGRPLASTTPDGKTEIYSYDTKGRISSRIDPHGIKIEYGYTDKDRLSTVILHTNPIQTLTIAYDTASNPVSYTDSQISPAPLYSYSYDEANRIISSSNNLIQKTIDYSYDHQGNVASMTMKETGGTALYSYNYLYDSASRLLSIQDSSTGTTTFSYFNTGRISGIGYPNGTQAAIVYNDNGMVDSIGYHRSDSTSIENFKYTRDSIGNITEVMMNSGSTTYNYDNLNRLTGADYPATSPLADELFSYDVNGNRSTSLQYSDWTYTTDNALTHYGNTDLDYDQNGNVIQQTVSSQTTTFGYDAFNRMRTVNATGMNVLYQYDHFGRRISKEVNSSTRNFMYDGYRVMAEFDGSGNLIRRYNYIPGSSLLVGMSEGNQNFDVLNDSVSVPRRLVGNGEAVVWAGDYQAFGAMTVQEDVDGDGTPVQFNLRFPGQYFDTETGMHYNGQRMYDPPSGRFFSRDPVQGDVFVPPNLNSYMYAYNNPLIFVDQDGRRTWSADFAGALWDQFTSPTATYNNFVAATRGKMGGITQAVTITFSAIAVAAGSYVFVASGALGATYELAEIGISAIGNTISRGAFYLYRGSQVVASRTGSAIMSGASSLAFFANTHPEYVTQEGQDFVGLMISLSGADTPPGPPSFTFSGVISEYVGGTGKYEQFGRNVKDFMNQAGSQLGIQSYNAYEWFIHNLPRYVGRRGRSSHGYGVSGMTYEMPRSL